MTFAIFYFINHASKNGKVPSQSILEVGVEKALSQAGFDDEMFQKRGGIFEWTRTRDGK